MHGCNNRLAQLLAFDIFCCRVVLTGEDRVNVPVRKCQKPIQILTHFDGFLTKYVFGEERVQHKPRRFYLGAHL